MLCLPDRPLIRSFRKVFSCKGKPAYRRFLRKQMGLDRDRGQHRVAPRKPLHNNDFCGLRNANTRGSGDPPRPKHSSAPAEPASAKPSIDPKSGAFTPHDVGDTLSTHPGCGRRPGLMGRPAWGGLLTQSVPAVSAQAMGRTSRQVKPQKSLLRRSMAAQAPPASCPRPLDFVAPCALIAVSDRRGIVCRNTTQLGESQKRRSGGYFS